MAEDAPPDAPTELGASIAEAAVDDIDQELSLLATVRSSVRDQGGRPSTMRVDELLDERLQTAERPPP